MEASAVELLIPRLFWPAACWGWKIFGDGLRTHATSKEA